MKKHLALLILIGSYTVATYSVSSDTLTIAMVGDIMMGTTFPTTQLPANGGADLFKDAAPILQQADLAVGNLEGTLCDGGHSTKGTGPNTYAFRTPTSYAPWLKEAGFDFLSMANNHGADIVFERTTSGRKLPFSDFIRRCHGERFNGSYPCPRNKCTRKCSH